MTRSPIFNGVLERFGTPLGGVVLSAIGVAELLGGILPEHVRNGILLLGMGLAGTGIFVKQKKSEERSNLREAEKDVRGGEISMLAPIRREADAMRRASRDET